MEEGTELRFQSSVWHHPFLVPCSALICPLSGTLFHRELVSRHKENTRNRNRNKDRCTEISPRWMRRPISAEVNVLILLVLFTWMDRSATVMNSKTEVNVVLKFPNFLYRRPPTIHTIYTAITLRVKTLSFLQGNQSCNLWPIVSFIRPQEAC